MKANITIELVEMLDIWRWKVDVNDETFWGYEKTYFEALYVVEDEMRAALKGESE